MYQLKRCEVIGLCMLLYACVISLSACSNGTGSESENAGQAELSTESVFLSMEQETLNLTDYSLSNEEMDYYLEDSVVMGENGYYYFDNEYLMYYDIPSGKVVPLCSRPDCTHNDNNCNAYFGAADMMYDTTSLAYEDGWVYVTGCITKTGSVNLCRIAADGSSRDDSYMSLYYTEAEDEYGNFEMTYPYFCVYRGYVYYSYDESLAKLYRKKLGSDEEEIVFSSGGTYTEVFRMKYSGDYLFFEMICYMDENYEESDVGLFAYNTKSGDTTLVKEGIGSYYMICNDLLYYAYGDQGIAALSLDTGEDGLIFEDYNMFESSFTVVDDVIYVLTTHIYTSNMEETDETNGTEESNETNADTLTAYSLDGTEIARLEHDDIEFCVFGDSTYFFAKEYAADEETGEATTYTVMLDVEKFLQSESSWTRLPKKE